MSHRITEVMGLLRQDLVDYPFGEERELRRVLNIHAALIGVPSEKLRISYLCNEYSRSFVARGLGGVGVTVMLIVQKRIGVESDGAAQLELVEDLIRHYTTQPLGGEVVCGEAKAETLYDPQHADIGVFTAMLTLPFTLKEKNAR